MTRTIDYFFGIGSPWAYIGLDPFLDLGEGDGAVLGGVACTQEVEVGPVEQQDRAGGVEGHGDVSPCHRCPDHFRGPGGG